MQQQGAFYANNQNPLKTPDYHPGGQGLSPEAQNCVQCERQS